MAVADQLAAEYRALTEACGLVDRSQRGKLALTGPDARAFLNGQVTNDVLALNPGEGCYAAFLTPKGKMLGDLRVLVLAPGDAPEPSDPEAPTLLLDTERVALQALFDMIRRFRVGYAVELHKRTVQRGLLSLVGPEARALIAAPDLPRVEHANRAASIGGAAVVLVATDVGVDVWCEAARVDGVRAELEGAGAVAVSDASAECLRVEHGRPRYGVDSDDSTIPQEAGLNERAVSFTKGCYVGQETVARLHWRGRPNRHLRGLLLSDPLPAGAELTLGERVVGRLSSVVSSPVLGPIGLALLRREVAPGELLGTPACATTARVVELPFRG